MGSSLLSFVNAQFPVPSWGSFSSCLHSGSDLVFNRGRVRQGVFSLSQRH
jgi:hypothetical protein